MYSISLLTICPADRLGNGELKHVTTESDCGHSWSSSVRVRIYAPPISSLALVQRVLRLPQRPANDNIKGIGIGDFLSVTRATS